MGFFASHSTGAALALFGLGVFGLSIAPLPAWLRPLDDSEEESPLQTFGRTVFSRPQSVPRPSQG